MSTQLSCLGYRPTSLQGRLHKARLSAKCFPVDSICVYVTTTVFHLMLDDESSPATGTASHVDSRCEGFPLSWQTQRVTFFGQLLN